MKLKSLFFVHLLSKYQIQNQEWIAYIIISVRVYPVRDELPGPETWLILREDEDKHKYQFSNAPKDTSFNRLAQMSHSRYWIERAIEDAKGGSGNG